MLDDERPEAPASETANTDTTPARRRRGASTREAGPPIPSAEGTAAQPAASAEGTAAQPAEGATATPARRRRTTKKAASAEPGASADAAADGATAGSDAEATPAKKTTRRRKTTASKDAASKEAGSGEAPAGSGAGAPDAPSAASGGLGAVLFKPPALTAAPAPASDRGASDRDAKGRDAGDRDAGDGTAGESSDGEADRRDGDEPRSGRRRRGRRGRGGKTAAGETGDSQSAEKSAATGADAADETSAGNGGPKSDGKSADDESSEAARKRRRRRRRAGSGDDDANGDDGVETVTHVRSARAKAESEVKGVSGSTRLEAKRQRRREGRDSGRRRAPVLTEAEFLARRESVDRVMLVREGPDRTQIAVLEDDVLAEHYVTKSGSTSYVGNVYLGKVQNVLPSMEAAFVDIGKGRNAVLYAGEVNYDASALEGRAPRIEQALKSGQSVLVQVTKDPIGHKGARLTSQVSLPGRYMVYVPEGRMTGISRKLPDTERTRLKAILKKITPEDAGVIIRTAAEGASEEELTRDLARLKAQWENIQKKASSASAPSLIYAEPDLVIRVIRDIFNEDFAKLVVQGEQEWDTVEAYVGHVAPDLAERLSRWDDDKDVFAAYRVDEQLAKALDRKVWLPSGGYLIFDRTEAMVVVDVNTGKFTGKGGNLEETVTKNNLEAAEELVRQLRLRDLGGIIVVDFIDMVLESNRELVLRRLMECLGRDRTKHQVAEVTSLGLVQMTRKRVGQGLLEAFTETCPECQGRGVKTVVDPFAAPPRKERRTGGHIHEATADGPADGADQTDSQEDDEAAVSPPDDVDTVPGTLVDDAVELTPASSNGSGPESSDAGADVAASSATAAREG